MSSRNMRSLIMKISVFICCFLAARFSYAQYNLPKKYQLPVITKYLDSINSVADSVFYIFSDEAYLKDAWCYVKCWKNNYMSDKFYRFSDTSSVEFFSVNQNKIEVHLDSLFKCLLEIPPAMPDTNIIEPHDYLIYFSFYKKSNKYEKDIYESQLHDPLSYKKR